MVQQQVQLHGSLGLTELRPVEQRQAQINDRRVHRVELVMEAELLLAPRQKLALPQQLLEERLVEFPRPMRVRVGKGRLVGRCFDSQMLQLPETARQPPTDLPQRLSLRQLAEQHRDELVPAGKAFAVAVRTM